MAISPRRLQRRTPVAQGLEWALALGLCWGLGLAAGCARTDEERRFDGLARTCASLGTGTTSYGLAQDALSGSYPAGPFCSTALAAMPEGDGCGAAAPDREVCQVFRIWFSADPRACPQGHCACELRLLRSALEAQGQGAAVCGARFDREGGVP